MALEQIKTQVLLLHSRQATLDALSAGFGDRYSVHLATSGSEALTTLGETPIHVIVSAQDLPGMSGLEALREAKKRSPDTIGILLAGEDGDDGLEALVGDQEVFQIVRGAVTPESLLELVESATQRVRLLAISESANDLAANVDEPAGEHIVMETSENGASIISDGTARLRAIRSQPSRAAAAVGGRQVDVLVLTKDEEFLATIMESSQELRTVHHANTPAQAEAIAREQKVGVLVTDAAMAAAEIESITERLRKAVPRLVAIVAGRRDDGELLMDLINRGQVYRFLLKPVSPGRARLAIEASVKHHVEAPDTAFTNKTRPAPGPARQPARPRPALARRTVGQPPKPAAKSEPSAQQSGTPTKPQAGTEPSGEHSGTPGRQQSGTPGRQQSGTPTKQQSGTPTKASLPAAGPAAADSEDGTESRLGVSGRFRRTVTGLSETLDGAAAKTDRFKLKPAYLAGGGAAVVLIAGIVAWLAQGETPTAPAGTEGGAQVVAPDPEPSPSVVESDVPLMDGRRPAETEAATEPAPVPAWQPFLDEARAATEAGEIVAPPGSNAIELYLAALEIAPDNAEIVAELEQIVADALGIAEQALLEQRTEAAAEALAAVRLASPDNLRLPFLDAQLAQLQLRGQLDRARAAIREQRFEDAAAALAAAEGLAGAGHPEVASLHQELDTARSAQRVDEVLQLANERLAEDALTAPPNNNARYYFELALSVDPESTAAGQGLALVAGKLVLRARDAIDNGALDDAGDMLEDARALDPESSEVVAALESLDSARAEAARLEAERLEAEQLAEAERRAETGEAEEGPPAERAQTAGAAPADTVADTAPATAADGSDLSFAAPRATANRNATNDPAAPFGTATGGGAADQAGSARPEPAFVPVSSLKRTNYVAPRYPRSAQRRNITGWADVSFTVTTQGDVVGVEIMESSPGDVFNEAATEAIGQWRFEPSIENGMPVERRVAVRLSFDLE